MMVGKMPMNIVLELNIDDGISPTLPGFCGCADVRSIIPYAAQARRVCSHAGEAAPAEAAPAVRVARLVQMGCPPARLRVVTFTNRAARELVSRVEAVLGIDIALISGQAGHA